MESAILLKVVFDKEKKRVIFVESDEDFVDLLFSFLTMPMGTIIRLTRGRWPAISIGCMENLYRSVENLEANRLRAVPCKSMLLRPQNGARDQCKRLRVQCDDTLLTEYYNCCSYKSNGSYACTASKYKLLSPYESVTCACGRTMDRWLELSDGALKSLASDARDRGIFVKGLSRFIVTDELQVMPASTAASFSVLSKLGVSDSSVIEEKQYILDRCEVFRLVKCSIVSKMALTEGLLMQKGNPQLGKDNLEQSSSIKYQIGGQATNENRKISIRLVLSKSKKIVCYAEVNEDFVDLLVSFLTIPLGYIVKEMNTGPSKGCISRLYKSVQDLDAEKYLKSDDLKEMLLSPKLAAGFGYEGQLLGVEEAVQQKFYYGQSSNMLTTDRSLLIFDSAKTITELTMVDLKSRNKEVTSGSGYMIGPAMFTVTDDLKVTPISPASGLSVLNKLEVSFSDIEEKVVQVGNREALRLLVASFVSERALTDAFILNTPKEEHVYSG